MSYDFPEDFFDPPVERPSDWEADPDVRRALDWCLSFISADEWKRRRLAVANRLYDAALGVIQADDKGKLYNQKDSFGWYLFLAEASLDHLGNYDPTYGSRVVPVFQSIGRNLETIKTIVGVEDRIRRALTNERAQPNGTLFELLVAACYARAGGTVLFVPEQKGGSRTHDLDVHIGGVDYAVECKRMETGEYSERERQKMRELWQPCVAGINHAGRSTLGNVEFFVPLDDVPSDHLIKLTHRYLASPKGELRWEGHLSSGSFVNPDLGPLQKILETDILLIGATRFQELVSGRYQRNRSFLAATNVKLSDNPRYMDECDRAILLQWQSKSDRAISGKARDVIGKLVEANDQLPEGRRSIVHIGFEAVEGDDVEKVRYEKIIASTERFDPRGKQLEYVYCHYFVPESPPDQSWAYDETTQLCPVRPEGPPPLDQPFLVLHPEAAQRSGPHWL